MRQHRWEHQKSHGPETRLAPHDPDREKHGHWGCAMRNGSMGCKKGLPSPPGCYKLALCRHYCHTITIIITTTIILSTRGPRRVTLCVNLTGLNMILRVSVRVFLDEVSI